VAHCHAYRAQTRLVIFFRSDSAHFERQFGVWGRWGMTPKFELRRDFCTLRLTTKFHHPTLNRSEVIVLTSKQTDAAEYIHLAPLRYAVGKYRVAFADRQTHT